jgi:hypothetical protein
MDRDRTVLDRPVAVVPVSSFPISLKPFGMCAALKQGEILGD